MQMSLARSIRSRLQTLRIRSDTRTTARSPAAPAVSAIPVILALITLPAAAPPAAAAEPIWNTVFDSGQNDQPADMVADADGNTYVVTTRGSGTDADIQTVALTPGGSVLWVSIYNGPAGGQDLGKAIALDPTGAVYVTGRAAVGSQADFVTIKYRAADGLQLWAELHDVSGMVADDPADIAVGPGGAVFVTGSAYSGTSEEGLDYETVRYESDGTIVWASRFAGPGPLLFANDTPAELAVDSQGDVVVTGSSNNGAGHPDYLTVKYDGMTGAELWESRYTGAGANDDAYQVVVDEMDDVYVTGISPQPGRTWATVKYSGADGAEIWESIDDPGQDELVHGLVYADGALYLTGRYDPDGDDGNQNDNVYTISHRASDGLLLWARSYGANDINALDSGLDLALDGAGQLYVTGQTSSFGAHRAVLLLRYDAADGTELEASTFDRPDTAVDIGLRLAVAAGHDVFVAASSAFDPPGTDLLMLRYPGSGPSGVGPGTADGSNGGDGALLSSLRIDPAPARESARVRFRLARPERVTVALFDVRGNAVERGEVRVLPTGEQAVVLDTRGLAGGVYLCRVAAGRKVLTGRVVVVP